MVQMRTMLAFHDKIEHDILIIIEDARTRRGSSLIECKVRKMAKTLYYVLVYILHTHLVFKCALNILFSMKLTQNGRNWSLLAETDTQFSRFCDLTTF